jgi:methylase of polypeptide subunit release factors
LRVFYTEAVDGEGRNFVEHFVARLTKSKPATGFGNGFEWCCGPGFVGFALLAHGLCERFCFADINPAAIECVKRTVEVNHLGDRVRYFVSDNLTSVPRDPPFDLVVGLPPAFFSPNPLHPQFTWGAGLRHADRGWAVHRAFYRDLADYVVDSAQIVILEVDPRATKVFTRGAKGEFIDPEPADLRPRVPLEDFDRMMRASGLQIDEVELVKMRNDYLGVSLICASKARDPFAANPADRVRLNEDSFVVRAFERDGHHQLYLAKGDELQRRLTLSSESAWLLELLERVEQQSVSLEELTRVLKRDLEEVRDAVAQLSEGGWVIVISSSHG